MLGDSPNTARYCACVTGTELSRYVSSCTSYAVWVRRSRSVTEPTGTDTNESALSWRA